MKSKLSTADIKYKLKKNTKDGDLFLLFTPFAIFNLLSDYDKVFLGEVYKTKFKLTLNKTFYPIPYYIEGTYNSTDENETAIEYVIKPRRFIIIFNNVIMIFASVIFIFIISVICELLLALALIALYVIVGWIIPRLILRANKKFMENELRRIIKIDS